MNANNNNNNNGNTMMLMINEEEEEEEEKHGMNNKFSSLDFNVSTPTTPNKLKFS
jgi:hypothetical protein